MRDMGLLHQVMQCNKVTHLKEEKPEATLILAVFFFFFFFVYPLKN